MSNTNRPAETKLSPLLRRMRNGWKLHVWRRSSPWNWWLSAPSGKTRYDIQLERSQWAPLSRQCKRVWDSESRLPMHWILGAESGLPEESIYVLPVVAHPKYWRRLPEFSDPKCHHWTWELSGDGFCVKCGKDLKL